MSDKFYKSLFQLNLLPQYKLLSIKREQDFWKIFPERFLFLFWNLGIIQGYLHFHKSVNGYNFFVLPNSIVFFVFHNNHFFFVLPFFVSIIPFWSTKSLNWNDLTLISLQFEANCVGNVYHWRENATFEAVLTATNLHKGKPPKNIMIFPARLLFRFQRLCPGFSWQKLE